MPTLTALKRKIAALQAQVERVTKAEMSGAIAKIRTIMDDYGITIDHLTNGALRRGTAAKKATASRKTTATKASKPTKGARPAKYQDPKSGATWSGLGRIPAWIATARNRDAFLIHKAGAPEEALATAPKKASSRNVASAKKTASAKKKVSAGPAAAKTPAPSKRATSKMAPAKASSKSAASKKSGAAAQKPPTAEPDATAS